MLVYFILLSVLYASLAFQNIIMLLNIPDSALKTIWHLANLVLLALALAAAYGLTFNKRLFSTGALSLIKNGVLILGAFTVILIGYPHVFDLPGPAGTPSIIELALTFLPYLLFAAPVVIYEKKRREAEAKK